MTMTPQTQHCCYEALHLAYFWLFAGLTWDDTAPPMCCRETVADRPIVQMAMADPLKSPMGSRTKFNDGLF